MASITEWLASLGLSEYAQRFTDNDIDVSILRHLTDQDLKELGVSLGHRRKILAAIAEPVRGAATSESATKVTSPPTDDAERRQVTVMFCDLVGSTALSTRLNPEDLRCVIGAYHKCVAETVSRFDGFVARYGGAPARARPFIGSHAHFFELAGLDHRHTHKVRRGSPGPGRGTRFSALPGLGSGIPGKVVGRAWARRGRPCVAHAGVGGFARHRKRGEYADVVRVARRGQRRARKA